MKHNQYSKDLRDLIKCTAKNETSFKTSLLLQSGFNLKYVVKFSPIITTLKDLVNYQDFGFLNLYVAKPISISMDRKISMDLYLELLISMEIIWFDPCKALVRIAACKTSYFNLSPRYNKWPLYSISGNCFANNVNIFHKTEVPTAILRCLTFLNLYWIKS